MDLHAEVAAIRESIKHHRIAVFSIVAFLIFLTIAVNVALRSATSPLTTSSSAKSAGKKSTPKKEVQVPLNTQYNNPFDKNSQYVNPFSQYKNPFDTLK
jgi:hypothetical protein